MPTDDRPKTGPDATRSPARRLNGSVPDRRSAPDRRSFLRFKVEFWLVALFMAVAFGAGFLLRGTGPGTGGTPAVQNAPSLDQGIIAPPLTQQQLEGSLPPGHPAVGSETSPTPTPGPSSSASP